MPLRSPIAGGHELVARCTGRPGVCRLFRVAVDVADQQPAGGRAGDLAGPLGGEGGPGDGVRAARPAPTRSSSQVLPVMVIVVVVMAPSLAAIPDSFRQVLAQQWHRAREPAAVDPADAAHPRPGQRAGAGRRARGLGAHRLSRHRGAWARPASRCTPPAAAPAGSSCSAGYRTKLTGLTAEEADAMFLAGLPAAAADLGLGEVLATTPAQTAGRAAAGTARAGRADPRPIPSGRAGLGARRRFAAGAGDDRRRGVGRSAASRFGTSGPTGQVVDRVLDPLGLVLKAGVWYLVARVADDARGPRTYRLSRVRAAAALDEQFARPAGFDLQEHWAAYQRDYEQRLFHGDRHDPAVAGRAAAAVPGRLGGRPRRARAMQPAGPDGWASDHRADRVGAARTARADAARRGGRGAGARRAARSRPGQCRGRWCAATASRARRAPLPAMPEPALSRGVARLATAAVVG